MAVPTAARVPAAEFVGVRAEQHLRSVNRAMAKETLSLALLSAGTESLVVAEAITAVPLDLSFSAAVARERLVFALTKEAPFAVWEMMAMAVVHLNFALAREVFLTVRDATEMARGL